jgi:hypothetical protein
VVTATTLIDFTFWTPSLGRVLHPVAAVGGPKVLSLFLGLCLINALLLDRSFERRWPSTNSVHRVLRFLVSGIPSLGIDLVLAWYRSDRREIGAGSPALELQKPSGSGSPGRGNRSQARALPWQRTLPGTVVEVIGPALLNLMFVLFLLAWHVARQAWDPEWPSMIVVCLAHGLSFYSVKSYLGSSQGELKPGFSRKTLRILPFLALLPSPIPLLSVAWASSSFFLSSRQNLSYGVYMVRTAVEQVPVWARYRTLIDRQMARKRQPLSLAWPKEVETGGRWLRQAASYQRLRCLLLGLEGILIIRVALWTLDRQPSWAPLVLEGLRWLTLAAFLLPLVGLFTILLVVYLGFPRTLWPEIVAYGAMTQFCLGAGLMSGFYVELGQTQEWGRLLEWMGLVGCMAAGGAGFGLVVLRGTETRDLMLWGSFAGFVALLGAFLATDQLRGEDIAAAVRTAALLSPFGNLALAGLFLKDILHPIEPRQAFRLLPRWSFTLLLLMLAAPLGGLAIPVWTYVRHRLWPRWEQGWASHGALAHGS